MEIIVRAAVNGDIFRLVSLYGTLESEQTTRKPIWALTDGLDERFDLSLFRAIERPDSFVLVGELEGVIVGFLWATIEPMLGRAGGAQIGRIRLIYTEPEARGVGIGHEMLETALEQLRTHGVSHFDAPVGPGQREAKNFFEGHRFAARSIIMHASDKGPEHDG